MTKTLSISKVPFRVKLGYVLGTGGDSVPYNLFYTYFLFFLTDVAGVSPAVAGIISFVSVCWDGITDPAVGYLSDTSDSKYGRRRPFMIGSIWPLALLVFLMFLPNPFKGGLQVAYYLVIALLLWTFYTTYMIPWTALGAELTQDFKERNIIRMMGAFVAYPLVALCNAGPMYVIQVGMARGLSINQCWNITGIIGGLLVILFGFISWKSTKGREIVRTEEEIKNARSKHIFKQFKEVLSLKPFRVLVAGGLVYLIGFTMANTSVVYLLTHNAGMHPGQQGTFWMLYSVFAIVLAPIPVQLANKIGRKKSFIIFGLLYVVNAAVFFIAGINSMPVALVYAFFIALTTSAFWGLYYAFVYDCSELDEYVNHSRREGSIVAIAQFLGKFGAAAATSVTGFMLQGFGYKGLGPGMESPETLKGILLCSTLLPGVIILVSMLIFMNYKLTRDRFEALKEAINARKEGRTVSTEGFQELL